MTVWCCQFARMMEDAYTELITEGRSENEAVGQVIRDFGSLDEVTPARRIASDLGSASGAESPARPTAPQYPPVTLEEAQGYADAQHCIRFRVSTAIMLFLLSPVVLIALPVAAESGLLTITDLVGVLIGLIALLVLVAVGVMLLATTSRETAPYTRISEGHVSAPPGSCAGLRRWLTGTNAAASAPSRSRSRSGHSLLSRFSGLPSLWTNHPMMSPGP